MELTIRVRNLDLDENLRKQVERIVHTAVDRHADQIIRISVSLADLNGPRGGVDKLCQMTAEVRGMGPVVISEKRPDVLAAIALAAGRLGFRVRHSLARRSRFKAPARRATIRAAA